MRKWTKLDAIAWKTIHDREPHGKPLKNRGKATNFAELEAFVREGRPYDLAFPEFLDYFYYYKSAEFFEVEPSDFFTIETRAFLAGTTEFLCKDFDLPVPDWVYKPEYFLAEPHDASGMSEFGFFYQLEDSDEVYRRRNVIFQVRGLIRL